MVRHGIISSTAPGKSRPGTRLELPANYEAFRPILWLDDMRTPLIAGVDVVRSYDEFVAYLVALKPGTFPELISFDHDLAVEHYPFTEEDHANGIPYEAYTEKTGLHCCRYIVQNKLPLRYWRVHSRNPIGVLNIERELWNYAPTGRVGEIDIPFKVDRIPEGVNRHGYRIRRSLP